MSFEVKYAERVGKLPVYLFIKLENMRNAALAAGKDVINLGVGDPDIPTPDFIVEEMAQAIKKPENHAYPSNYGTMAFREAAAAWIKKRFGESEIHVLTNQCFGHLCHRNSPTLPL